MEDRRRHERQPSQESVKIEIVGGEGFSQFPSVDAFEVLITDISETGLGLHSEISLEPGQVVKLVEKRAEWNFSSDTGVVMWTVEASDGVKAGVKFT